MIWSFENTPSHLPARCYHFHLFSFITSCPSFPILHTLTFTSCFINSFLLQESSCTTPYTRMSFHIFPLMYWSCPGELISDQHQYSSVKGNTDSFKPCRGEVLQSGKCGNMVEFLAWTTPLIHCCWINSKIWKRHLYIWPKWVWSIPFSLHQLAERYQTIYIGARIPKTLFGKRWWWPFFSSFQHDQISLRSFE